LESVSADRIAQSSTHAGPQNSATGRRQGLFHCLRFREGLPPLQGTEQDGEPLVPEPKAEPGPKSPSMPTRREPAPRPQKIKVQPADGSPRHSAYDGDQFLASGRHSHVRQRLIAAENSDLFDVLAYIAYALPPLTGTERADAARFAIRREFNDKQQVHWISEVLLSASSALTAGRHGGRIYYLFVCANPTPGRIAPD
jgi:hypothetical protein